jgi:glucose/arabinose dehydrogenase
MSLRIRLLIGLGMVASVCGAGATRVLAAAPSPTPVTMTRPQTYLADAAFPTNMAFAPDGRLFFTEKDTGAVRIIQDGRLLPDPFATFPVTEGGETGLLGIAIDPNFPTQPWVYFTLSYKPTDMNRLLRAKAEGNGTRQVEPVRDLLSAQAGYHNGGDIAFGPDGKLYVTVGEVHDETRAQDPNDIGGKILRLNPDGTVPDDNPLGTDNPAYSMGHRNSFGICFDPATGDLWETENGPDSHDEVNRIEAGGNYGWPDQLGPGGAPTYIDPVLDFPAILAPTGCAVWHNELWFGDIGGGLHRYPLPIDPAEPQGGLVTTLPSGVTDLEVGPDDALYISTMDSIQRMGGEPGTPPVAAATQPADAPVETGNGATVAAWAAAVIALIVVVAGGLWFRHLARRDEERTPS